jgi:hypothetical protein
MAISRNKKRINRIVKKIKKWGYVISIPTIISLSIYFINMQINIKKQKNELLESQIDFLQKKMELFHIAKHGKNSSLKKDYMRIKLIQSIMN